ncbi:GxxExxY protein [Allopontixanthobacter sp.]|uniref:GxxExxY protein n=1 Tax=Allopontixanthobacter sp. TaxID=2906452 RepID=UPI002ABA24A8|nr:GxxExxY protein [Allopontixanthobacter sp.]MDZ4306772.1 GxxExxY protein [Allopontixanthobacter sp.]
MKPINLITADVVGAAIRIHRELGPGLLESVYEMVLGASLAKQGYSIARQHPVAVHYDGMHFANAFRVDLLVDNRLVVEIKSVEQLSKAHAKQVLTYLRLLEQPVGLLLNFSCATMKEGIKRLVNDYRP